MIQLEDLLQRPSWAVNRSTVLIGCMYPGCGQIVEIRRPGSVAETKTSLIKKGWFFQKSDGLTYCRIHKQKSTSLVATAGNGHVHQESSPETPKPHSAAASRSLRRMFMLLDDHFSVDRCRYEAGWSDAKVAQGCGLSAAAVAHHRDDAYGPLRLVDPATLNLIVKIEAETKTLKGRLQVLEEALIDVKRRIDLAEVT